MINLLDLNRNDMESFFAYLGEKKFRASQILKWIYHDGVIDFSNMSNISKSFKSVLKEKAVISLPKIITTQKSKDGTIKWLLEVSGGSAIEVVYIPENDRGTLCISSQAGCIMACPFCSTAHEGFNRNLTTGEIIAQIWIAKNELGWDKKSKRKITNIVLMGMGEPLLNYDQVVKACNLMMDDLGFGLSKRRVTLSTSGVAPKIIQLKKDSDVSLAISLHAPNDELRNEIVPINKKYQLKELIDACNYFVDSNDRRKHITWEYIMLDNINDHRKHALELSKLISGIPGKINLIPFNEFKGAQYKSSSIKRIEGFKQVLVEKGFIVTIRKTRGDDISAACGQLVGDVKDKSRRERLLVRM